jgi:hypothetical protein
MLQFFKHRRDGLARISLALGMVLITLMLQHTPSQEEDVADAGPPKVFQTQNAQFSKCTKGQKETKLGKFGCAVVLKPKVASSSIRFLSSGEK